MTARPARARRAVLAATAVVGLAAPLLVASPAHAERAVRRDGTGDTWRWEGGTSYTESPRTANLDLTRFVIDHTDTRVELRGTFSSLTRARVTTYLEAILTDEAGQRWTLYTLVGPGARTGTTKVFEGDRERSCAGARHTVSYERDTITTSVPRRCLARPTALTWRGFSVQAKPNADDTFTFFYDDASSAGAFPSEDEEPALARG